MLNGFSARGSPPVCSNRVTLALIRTYKLGRLMKLGPKYDVAELLRRPPLIVDSASRVYHYLSVRVEMMEGHLSPI